MAGAPAPSAPDAGLASLVVSPLALDAFDFWAAGTLGRHSLEEGRAVDTLRHVNGLQGFAITCHPRLRRLAQERCDALAAARVRSLSDEVA